MLLGAKGIASSNKCLTSRNKKLLGTSATLVVTSAVVTSASNRMLLGAFLRFGEGQHRCRATHMDRS